MTLVPKGHQHSESCCTYYDQSGHDHGDRCCVYRALDKEEKR